MKITNKLGLPKQLVTAVEGFNSEYQKSKTGKENYSVTQLLSPAYQQDLKQKYKDELEEDISDSIWMLLGNAIHSILERASDEKCFVEERLSVELYGTIISGAMDYLTETLLQDYKVTSVYTIIYGSRVEEWAEQLNMYRYLVFKNLGYEIEKLEVVAILRDWSKTKAMTDGSYPQNNIQVINIPLWSYQATEQYIMSRIEAMREKEPCTPSERWDKPTKYAVMKEGRKSAVKLFDIRSEAEIFIDDVTVNNKLSLIVRKGESTRCENYCNVNKYCEYYKSIKG